MLWLILGFIGVMLVMAVFLRWMNQWASQYVQQFLARRLEALREITEEESVPAAWRTPFQARIAREEERGSNPARIAKIQQDAQKHCLRQIDELIEYIQNVKFEDTQNTQELLLNKLREQKGRWETATWDAMMEMRVREKETLAD